MRKYYHIGITYGSGAPAPLNLEPIIKLIADDWMRYSPTNWIIWTDKSPITVSEMVGAALGPLDHFLVVSVDLNTPTVGLLPPWAWTWLNHKRDLLNPNLLVWTDAVKAP